MIQLFKYISIWGFATMYATGHAQVKDPFPYKFSETIEKEKVINPSRWKGGYYAQQLSFIGLYKEALADFDSAVTSEFSLAQKDSLRNDKETAFKKDSSFFVNEYTSFDARNYILKRARDEKIIIFNEAHHNPRNRVFFTSLLKDLKQLGFIYLACETFTNRVDNETFLQRVKGPALNAGYYSMEPQFGNLIREANKLGFTMWPYEDTVKKNASSREINQAKNIKSLIQRDPQARIIVYCGHSHIIEDSVSSWGKAMAGRLYELTGIDPLTIEQTQLAERSDPQYEDPYYKNINPKTYSILLDKAGNPFNKGIYTHKVDILLFTPRTTYKHNRPDWIFENGKVPYFIAADSVNVSFPLLVRAYFNEDDIKNIIVPIDIIEIKNKEELAKTALAVFPDKSLIIQLTDTDGKKQIIAATIKNE